jgi:hypothetical protein
MTKIVTVRVTESELARCDAQARRLGITRTALIRARLFEQPLPSDSIPAKRFASSDLVGSFALGRGSTNERVRAALGAGKRA